MSKIVIKSIANRASDQTQNLFKKGLFDRFQSWFYCQFYDARFWIFYLYSWFSLANIIHLLLLFHLLVVVVVDVDVVGGFPHKCELQMPPESVGTMLQNIFWIGEPRPHFVFFLFFSHDNYTSTDFEGIFESIFESQSRFTLLFPVITQTSKLLPQFCAINNKVKSYALLQTAWNIKNVLYTYLAR